MGAPGPWAFEGFARAWASQSVEAQQGAEVRFSLVDVGLVECPLRVGSNEVPRLALCAGAEVGLLETESQGFTVPKSAFDPSLRLVAPASLSLPIARGVSLRLAAEFGVAAVRDQFVYGNPNGASRLVAGQPLFTGEADLGLAIAVR